MEKLYKDIIKKGTINYYDVHCVNMQGNLPSVEARMIMVLVISDGCVILEP